MSQVQGFQMLKQVVPIVMTGLKGKTNRFSLLQWAGMRAVRLVALKRMPTTWARLWIVCEEFGLQQF